MTTELIDFSRTGRVPSRTPFANFDPPDRDPIDDTPDLIAAIKQREAQRDAEDAQVAKMDPSIASTSGFSPEDLDAMKHTFTATGGNLAAVARSHGVDALKVASLATSLRWPVYGVEPANAEKGRKTRLENLAEILERQMFELASSLGAEEKLRDDVSDRGLNSKFAASLSQRSSAFGAVFDRYMRVMGMLEPEVFAADPSNTGAMLRSRAPSPDALGGVDGVNRMMADFAARLSVGIVQGLRPEVMTNDDGILDLNT